MKARCVLFLLGACGGTTAQPRVLATGQAVRGIALDDSHVYWSNLAFDLTQMAGQDTIERIDLAGGTPELLAGGLRYPYAVAVDPARAYWIDYNFNAVNYVGSAPLDGGTAAAQPSSSALLDEIATNGTTVAWAVQPAGGGDALVTAPAGALAMPSTLVQQPRIADLALDASTAYYAGDDGVHSIPLAGGTPALLATSLPATALAIDDTSVYWLATDLSAPAATSAIMRAPKGGGAAQVLVSSASASTIRTDGKRVYWFELVDGAPSELRSVPVEGGTPETLVGGLTGTFATALAVDDHVIAFADRDRLMVIDR